MTWAVRGAVLVALVLSAIQVFRIRGRLATLDADPARIREVDEGLQRIPTSLGGGAYEGRAHPIDLAMVKEAGADLHLSNEYRDRSGNAFRLYVGASISNEENFHAPSYCMPAAGWEVLSESTVPFGAYASAGEARMRRLLLQKAAEKMVVYYWFQAGRRIADHEWAVRLGRFRDLLLDEPLHPTVIVAVYTPVRSDVATTESAVTAFLNALGPPLRTALIGVD
jgi:EpsI family protein